MSALSDIVAKFRKGSPNIAAAFDEVERRLVAVEGSASRAWTELAEHEARLDALENEAPPPPPPATGTIIFEADYSPGDASEWFGGAGGGGGHNNQNAYNYFRVEDRHGEKACRITLEPGSGAASRMEFGRYIADITQGVMRYDGTQFEIPPDFDWSSVGPNGINLTQHDQSNGIASAPFHLNLGAPRRFPRGLGYIMQTGTWQDSSQVFGSGLEYVSGDTSWAGHWIDNPVVIPSGQVPEGRPIQVILAVFRTCKNEGTIQSFWKLKGEPQTAWRASPVISKTRAGGGFPTLQHFPGQPCRGHDVYPDTLVHKWGAYAGAPVPSKMELWHYRGVTGSSFETVASRFV